tara:strand:+ start:33172 stop:33480 length:309 start_codon:yes stop_codon:yes gene_type:complete
MKRKKQVDHKLADPIYIFDDKWGANKGPKTLIRAAICISTKAIIVVFDAISGRPVWPSDTRHIIPNVIDPIQPVVKAWITTGILMISSPVKASKKRPKTSHK